MISLKGIEKSFGRNHVLQGVDLTVDTGEVVSIIGASGSGKSTFLRTINFLEPADSGIITLDDICVDTRKIFLLFAGIRRWSFSLIICSVIGQL